MQCVPALRASVAADASKASPGPASTKTRSRHAVGRPDADRDVRVTIMASWRWKGAGGARAGGTCRGGRRRPRLGPTGEPGHRAGIRDDLDLVPGQLREGEAGGNLGFAVEDAVAGFRGELDHGEPRGPDRDAAEVIGAVVGAFGAALTPRGALRRGSAIGAAPGSPAGGVAFSGRGVLARLSRAVEGGLPGTGSPLPPAGRGSVRGLAPGRLQKRRPALEAPAQSGGCGDGTQKGISSAMPSACAGAPPAGIAEPFTGARPPRRWRDRGTGSANRAPAGSRWRSGRSPRRPCASAGSASCPRRRPAGLFSRS